MPDTKRMKSLNEISNQLQQLFQDDLLQLVLYNDRDPHRDDLLVIIREYNLSRMKNAHNVIKKMTKLNLQAPYFMTPEFIMTSLDSYPLEFLNIKTDYSNLYLKDTDYIKETVLDNNYVRLQIERELKSRHLLICSNYLYGMNSNRYLEDLISRSVLSLKPVLKGILFLHGKTIPVEYSELIDAVQKSLNLNLSSFDKAFSLCYKKEKMKDLHIDTFFDSYLKEIDNLIHKTED
jgi:hypothetical protein